MTLDEFLALPEEKPYLELINGKVEQKPFPTNAHAWAQTQLLFSLVQYSKDRDGQALVEAGITFRPDVLNFRVPDVTYFVPAQMLDLSADYANEAPFLAAEVRSKEQSQRSVRDRLAFLRERGGRATLLVDPAARTVEVQDGDRKWTATADDVITLETLPGFSLRAVKLFELDPA